MIFQSKLINGIRQGTTTKTVRPALPSHRKNGPWKVGDVLPVKATMNGDTLFRIEIQDVQLTTIGKLELTDIRAAGFKHRDLFLEAWKTQTGTVNPPSLHKLVWLVTFATYSAPRYLALREPQDLSVKPSNRADGRQSSSASRVKLPAPHDGEVARQVVPVDDEHGYVLNRSSALDDADEQIGVLPCLSEHEQRQLSRDTLEEWNRKRAGELAVRQLDSIVGRCRRLRSMVDTAAGRREFVAKMEAKAKHARQRAETDQVLANDKATNEERAAARQALDEAGARIDEGEADDVLIDLLQSIARLDAQLLAVERKAKAA